MVDRLQERGVLRTARIAAAFRSVPRHLFLPDLPLERVYSGEAIVIRTGSDGAPLSSSSEPAVMACMLEQLAPSEGERVLEVGAGSGYNAALLASLVGAGGEVTTIDLDETVASEAREKLARAGHPAVRVLSGDGWLGAPGRAPYDAIEITVGVWDLSPHWLEQLRPGGRLVAPLWLRGGAQACVAFRREGQRLSSTSVTGCGFMRLRGPHAGPEAYVAVDGWHLSSDDAAAARLDVLAELLATEPRVGEAPEVPGDAWMGFLLLEPGAVALYDSERKRTAIGVFEPDKRSLALIESVAEGSARRRLAIYGRDDAALRLRVGVESSRGFDLRALRVEAVPAGSSASRPGALVLRRPHYDIAVWDER